MAQQFEVQALGLNGIPYRIEIYNDNYGGATVTQLNGDQQFVRFEGGQRERVGIEPIWGKEVRINVRTNEDLSPLFGLEDRDAEVRVFRTDTSSLVWKGFILTDFFQDEPLTDLPGVELRGVDGLTTLEGDSFDALSGVSDSDIGEDGSFISYTDLFTGVLSTLYDSPLDVEFAVEWYPDAGGQLTSSDNPLRFSGARPDVYYDSEDGAWFDQQSALEDALKSQGLEIRQAVVGGELTWLVAQPTDLSASSKTWRYAPDGTEDASSPFLRDLSLDLSGADTNRPTREFERRSGSVSVTHDHKPIDNLVPNGGFENTGDWQITGSSTNPSYYAVREKYSNLGSKLPPQTQNNEYALVFEYDSQGTDFPLSQDLGEILGLPQGSAFTLKQTFLQNLSIFGGLDEFSVRLNIGQHWLKEETRKIEKDADPGTGSVFVGQIDSKIPSGSIIPVTEDPATLDNSDDHSAKATIRLTEPVTPGDGELTGEISSSLKSGQIIRYPAWTTTQSRLPIAYWKISQGVFAPVSVRAPTVLEDGTEISGQSKIEYGAKHSGTNNLPQVHAVLDDVQLSVDLGGSKLKKSTREASVEAAGQSRNVQVLLSSGPTLENESRVKGLGPGGLAYNATGWGIGAGGGSLSLAGLQARERLRYLREHLERQQLTVYARDKSPVVTGEEIVQFDGKTWRIAEFSSDPYNGEIGLTLIQHADAGTTDLSIATVRDTEDGGTTGGGGTAPAVGGGGGGVTAGAIASALDHDPGLSGGIRTSIRASGSATDDALVTEQAVREALGTVQVDLSDDGTANIDPLRQISVVGDTNGIFSGGDESGELAVDVSDVAILTENETFTSGLNVIGGNVGIGTTSPDHLLHVGGKDDEVSLGLQGRNRDSVSSEIIFADGGFSSSMGIRYDSQNNTLHIDDNYDGGNDSTIYNRVELVTVERDGGNVGIGTTSPSYTLDAAGDIRTQGIFRGTELRDDSGYIEGLFGEGFVLKDQRNSNGRSYMELDDMRVRGQLRAHIFKKDIVRATNALLYVSDAAQTTEDVTTPSSTGSTFTLFVDTSVFQAGEEITFKDSSGGGITEVVGTVSSVVGSTTRGGQTVYELSVTLNFGTSATIPGGSTVVRTSGARMLLDASTADAPVQTLFDQNGNRRMAEGNLDGQFGITSETYGMAAGTEGGAHIKATENGVRIYDSTGTAFFKVDPSLNPEVQLDGDALVDGTVTSDKINVNDVLTLEPGAGFFAGGGQEQFAFGDFSLDRKTKGLVNHTGVGAYDKSEFGLFDEVFFSRTDIDMGGTDPNSDAWAYRLRAEYSIISDDLDNSAFVEVTVRAKDGAGSTLGTKSQEEEVVDIADDSGFIEIVFVLPDGTKEVEAQFLVGGDGSNNLPSEADIGDDPDGNLNNPPETEILSSNDFFGPDGATWRESASMQIEINGRGNSSSKTTGAGQIWVRDKVIENSDLRNKSGVQGIEGGLDVMRDLRGITYNRGAGIAAQDLIGTFEDALHGSEKEGYSVAYNALWAPAIDAIHSLDDRLSQVENQINA